ncbi:FAD/NAD(P)-binding domain-containing protein [Hyaloscypha variabilis F]|uniref:FAD/NAD(P)-binding domain-containing protein n=1 Tax=Hyaloscypha variabilis (strain UAMH 11265 / GT02V1 / F) TaxID=1149755 RepID=A0A2J6RRU0_HYAVF|nr:FAD/NAD(P)-binding domain-containing protein [Hyaloscypha variabilis F]
MTLKTNPKFNILIIGGGISGFGASIGLARTGHTITVLERSASLQTFGGGLLISSNALRVLEEYGLLGRLKEVSERWENHTVFRHDGVVLDILSNGANGRVFGFEMLNVTRPVYQRVLYEAAVKEGVDVRFGAKVEGIQESERGPSVRLSTGEVLSADLIIGADGIKSPTRAYILNGDIALQPNSTCYQCTIPASLMLSSPLTAPLIKEHGLQSWWGPNTHLICGRTKNGDSYSASFFIHPSPSSPLPSSSPSHTSSSNAVHSGTSDNNRKGDISHILSNIDPYEDRIKAFINLIPEENCKLWNVAQLPDLQTWVSSSGRIVVLGDAAHAMSPHLGQGAAISIEDGGVLSLCLARTSSTLEIKKATKAYETVMKGRAERVKKAAEMSGRWKTLGEGKERERRDEGFRRRLEEEGEKGEWLRASGHLAWVYGWEFRRESERVLEGVFGREVGEKARI